jgi:hypothetical protein
MRQLLLALACAAGLALPARAAPLEASFVVVAGGLTVLEVEAAFELAAQGYSLRTALRTRGIAATFFPGEQTTLVEGRWRAAEPAPGLYRSAGVWRGRPRRTELDYGGEAPVLRLAEPPNDDEREEVPAELRRGTLDALSAIVKLSRIVAETGRCDGTAAVFDGRRRTEVTVRTLGRDQLPPSRSYWSGTALRCGYEGRVVAGFRRDQDRREAAEPQRGVAWIAEAAPGGPAIPVRLELPSRWFGSIEAYLLRAPASGQQARQ